MLDEKEKRIGLSDNSFEAGGKKFIVHSSVNIEMYRVLEELQVRARFGMNYAQLHAGYVKWVELKNAKKDFDADVQLRNVFEGVARGVNKQQDPLVLICTLFCWPQGEPRVSWDEEKANETIKLWSEEGYPVEDFLLLGLQFVRRYQSGSLTESLSISAAEAEGQS